MKKILILILLFPCVGQAQVQLKEDYTRAHIDSLRKLIQNSGDKSFDLFYHNGAKVDSIMHRKGYAQGIVDYLIAKEEIDPKLWTPGGKDISQTPDWNKLRSVIGHKYSKVYADRTVLGAQIRWYGYKKDTIQLLKYNVEKIDKYGLDTVGLGRADINNIVFFQIFMHSKAQTVLMKGRQWMEVILKAEPDNSAFMDTYANILYKAGHIKEGISFEQKAKQLEETHAATENRVPDKVYKETLEKMKAGLPTWSNQ